MLVHTKLIMNYNPSLHNIDLAVEEAVTSQATS